MNVLILTNPVYEYIKEIIIYLLDKKKTKLKNNVFTVLGNDDILIDKGDKTVTEKTVLKQVKIENAKEKFNFVVNNLLIS
jgi:hypothetical protein